MQVNRRLYRCRHDRRLAGVASGVAEYFDLDPSLVRVLWFVSIFFGGVTLLLYIGMAIIVPLEPVSTEAAATPEAAEASVVPEGHRHATRDHGRWTTFVGLALIFFGSLALIDRYLPVLDVKHLLVPAVAIGLGAFLVASAVRRDPKES
jgi:phage shock protein PspC (stress-responsive transcriptional regulator)